MYMYIGPIIGAIKGFAVHGQSMIVINVIWTIIQIRLSELSPRFAPCTFQAAATVPKLI